MRMNMAGGGPSSGGVPWFRPRPSPYNPNAPVQQPQQGQPPPDQGPPVPTTGPFGNMSPRDIIALLMSLAGGVGGALGNRQNFNPNTGTNDPNLQKLLATMQGRLDKSEPLYDSIMAMANGLLPTRYQKGGGGMP